MKIFIKKFNDLNWKDFSLLFLIGTFIIFHIFLISQTFVVDNLGNIRSTITGYGDIPLHLTQITKFAFEKSINLEEPIFYGQLLRYPFLINLISGLLLRITGNFPFSVNFPSFVFSALSILIIFYIYKAILKNSFLSYLSLLIFFLGSGFGGFDYIKNAFENKLNINEFMSYIIQNHITTVVRFDAKYPSQNIDFGSPISLVFLHQRAFFLGLFGFTAYLGSLMLIRHYQKSKLLFIIATCFFGLLPLMHTHSFIAAGITTLSFLIIALFEKNFSYAKKIIMIGIMGGAIALPQLIYLTGPKIFGEATNFLVFRLGWMVPTTIGSIVYPPGELPTVLSSSFLQFLWINFGVILPVFIFSIFILLKNKIIIKSGSIFIFSFALSGSILFIIVQLIRFQPWDWDNNKILVYFQFFAIPLILFTVKIIYSKRKIIGTIILVAFTIISLFSGILDMIPRIMTPINSLPIIFEKDSQIMASYIRQYIPEKDLILTGTGHRNLVDSLAGRSVIIGYPGWLWSRGINYGERESEVRNFYLNPSTNDTLVRKYPIKYILLSNQEISDFGANKFLFDQNFKKVYEIGEFILYKLD